jgi:hypothetical protein
MYTIAIDLKKFAIIIPTFLINIEPNKAI